jgi:hypothetical protein
MRRHHTFNRSLPDLIVLTTIQSPRVPSHPSGHPYTPHIIHSEKIGSPYIPLSSPPNLQIYPSCHQHSTLSASQSQNVPLDIRVFTTEFSLFPPHIVPYTLPSYHVRIPALAIISILALLASFPTRRPYYNTAIPKDRVHELQAYKLPPYDFTSFHTHAYWRRISLHDQSSISFLRESHSLPIDGERRTE